MSAVSHPSRRAGQIGPRNGDFPQSASGTSRFQPPSGNSSARARSTRRKTESLIYLKHQPAVSGQLPTTPIEAKLFLGSSVPKCIQVIAAHRMPRFLARKAAHDGPMKLRGIAPVPPRTKTAAQRKLAKRVSVQGSQLPGHLATTTTMDPVERLRSLTPPAAHAGRMPLVTANSLDRAKVLRAVLHVGRFIHLLIAHFPSPAVSIRRRPLESCIVQTLDDRWSAPRGPPARRCPR